MISLAEKLQIFHIKMTQRIEICALVRLTVKATNLNRDKAGRIKLATYPLRMGAIHKTLLFITRQIFPNITTPLLSILQMATVKIVGECSPCETPRDSFSKRE